MVTVTAASGVALIALGMVLTPGPNMMYLTSRSISQSRRAGLVSLAGVAAGFLCYLLAATVGLTTLFLAVPEAFVGVKLAGAAYLGFLAWRTVRPGGTSTFAVRDLPEHGARRLFAMGLLTNLLNPKIALMYTALIPQFVDPARGPVWSQALVLGAVQILVALSINALIVIAAAAIAGFLRARPTWMRAQRWATGTVLGFFAIRMATSRCPSPAT